MAPSKKQAGNNQIFVIKLAQGEYDLSQTFWLYGVVALVFFSILISASLTLGEALFTIILMLTFFVYSPFIMLGLIQTAKNHRGKKMWARLLMFFAALWIIAFVGMFLIFVAIL